MGMLDVTIQKKLHCIGYVSNSNDQHSSCAVLQYQTWLPSSRRHRRGSEELLVFVCTMSDQADGSHALEATPIRCGTHAGPSLSRVSHHDVAVVVPADAAALVGAPPLVDPLAVDVDGLGQRLGGGAVARFAGTARGLGALALGVDPALDALAALADRAPEDRAQLPVRLLRRRRHLRRPRARRPGGSRGGEALSSQQEARRLVGKENGTG